MGEDLEVVVRLHRRAREASGRARIAFVPDVVCWTEAPETIAGLRAQRTRWQQGALETLARHRRMLFNPRYGRIGCIAMPQLILEDVLGPPAELTGYVVTAAGLAFGWMPLDLALAFFAVSLLLGTALSIGALALEESQLRRTPTARALCGLMIAGLLENLGYRQLNILFRAAGMWRHWRKTPGWLAVPRVGFAAAPASDRRS